MKFYISSSSQKLAKSLLGLIENIGHEVTARWITEDTKFGLADAQYSEKELEDLAVMDHQDVVRGVDGLILIAETDGKYARGGKHVETGIALAHGYNVFVLGPKENVFHRHPNVKCFSSVCGLLTHIDKIDSEKGRGEY